MSRLRKAVQNSLVGLNHLGEQRADRVDELWDNAITVRSCFRIRVIEFSFILAMISSALGVACLIVGLCPLRIHNTPMLFATSIGCHEIIIAFVLTALIRRPGRRMAALYVANALLHFLLTSTSLTVDSIELSAKPLAVYRKSLKTPDCSMAPKSGFREHSLQLPLLVLSIYLEVLCLGASLVGLVVGLRLRRYITSRQRYDLARASRDEIAHVFVAETHPELPRPPFRLRFKRRGKKNEKRESVASKAFPPAPSAKGSID